MKKKEGTYVTVSHSRMTAVSLSLALHALASHLPQWLIEIHTTPLLWPYIFCISVENMWRKRVSKNVDKINEMKLK